MKKLIALLLAACLMLGLMTTAFAADEKSNDIVILHTDDAHCGVNDNLGYAGVAAYKAEMEKTHNYVALVDCGDAIQGESIGTLSAGAYLVDIMNEVGYDFAAFGNHEFDYKLPQLAKLTKQAKYQYLACNFKYIGKGTSDLNYKPYEIVTYGDKKVAFIGIVTPESFTKSTPAYFQDESGNYIYSFSEDETGTALYETVQKTVDEVRAAGADYIIAMGHLGNEGITDRWTSKAVIANTTGIDAVLDGHDHIAGVQKVANKDGKQIVLTEPGTKFENLGKLTIKTDGTITAELISPKEFTEKDAGITAYITKLTDTFKEYVSKVVAKSDVELPDYNGDKRLVRNTETALGDLAADAFRVMMDADIGIMNGASLLNLNNSDTVFTKMRSVLENTPLAGQYKLIVIIIAVVLVAVVLGLFLRTRLGLAIRATGNNPDMVRSSSINPVKTTIIGLCISNAFTALSGCLLAQSQKSVSIDIGTGMVTVALASLLIGGAFFGKGKIPLRIFGMVVGAFVFRLVYTIALRFNLPAFMLKFVSSVIVILAISGPYLKKQLPYLKRRFGKERTHA